MMESSIESKAYRRYLRAEMGWWLGLFPIAFAVTQRDQQRDLFSETMNCPVPRVQEGSLAGKVRLAGNHGRP